MLEKAGVLREVLLKLCRGLRNLGISLHCGVRVWARVILPTGAKLRRRALEGLRGPEAVLVGENSTAEPGMTLSRNGLKERARLLTNAVVDGVQARVAPVL